MAGDLNKSNLIFVTKKLLQRGYLFLPAIFLFIYIIIRAKVISLTWDEANTFWEYVRTPHWFTQDYNYMSANNHLLNTWLMKCSVWFFGDSEFALRLPNVLSGGIFLVAAMKLSEKMFEKKWMIFSAFILLTFNPYVLDFFSTARGYGISLALMGCALVQLAEYVMETHDLKRGFYAQIFLVFATLANLTLVYLLLATTFLLVCNRFFFHRENRPVNASVKLTFIPIAVLLFFIPYSNQLKACGALYFGDEAKSAASTFLSLSQSSFYDTFYSVYLTPVFTVIFSAIPLFSLLLVARNIFSMSNDVKGRWMVLVILLLLLCIAGPVVQHLFLKTNFLSGRTALFYIPLLLLSFLCLLHFFPAWLKNMAIGFAAIFSIAHFYFAANLHSLYDWKEQADVKDAMLLLKKNNSLLQDNIYANIISTDLPFEKQINYYRMRFGMDNFSHASRKENVPSCSWYYLPESAIPYPKTIEVIGSWPGTKTILYRFLDRPKLKYITEVWQDFEHEDAFPQLRTDTIFIGNKGTFAGGKFPFSIQVPLNVPDSLKKDLVATLNCRLYYNTKNTSALLVFCFDDGNNESWEAMHISELSIKPKEWSITGWTRPVPEGTKKIRVFLWNRDNSEVLMDNVALRLLQEQ